MTDDDTPQPRFMPFKCPTCNGYGSVSYGKLICKSCRGRGQVIIDQVTGLAVDDDEDEDKNSKD